jgi:hypothetical protein
LQDKASSAAQILATLNNTSAQRIAQIQADTSLSVTDKQTASAQIIAQGNNATTLAAQNLVNAGALANIAANSTAQQRITQIQEDNKRVLQNSAGAQQLYSSALQNIQAFMTNPNLNTDQQATAMNNTMDTLNEGLKMFGNIDANTNINSVLRFGQPSSDANSSTGPPSNLGDQRQLGPPGSTATPASGSPTYSTGTPDNPTNTNPGGGGGEG